MKKIDNRLLKINGKIFNNITIVMISLIIGFSVDKYFNTKPLFIIIAIGAIVINFSIHLLVKKTK